MSVGELSVIQQCWQGRDASPFFLLASVTDEGAEPPLTSCSTQEIGLSSLPGQHSRADSEGAGMEEPILRVLKQKNQSLPLLSAARGEPVRSIQESSP